MGVSVTDQTWTLSGSLWEQKSPVTSPPARRLYSMAYDSTNKRVIMFGGQIQNGSYLYDLWSWNGTNWTDITPGITPSARADAGIAYDPDRGVLVIFGGVGSGGNLNDTWEFDGTSWSQISTAAAPSARVAPAMTYDTLNDRVLLFGGSNSGVLGETWSYDGTNWTQLTPAASPGAKAYARMVFDPSTNNAVLFGGIGSSAYSDELWFYGEEQTLPECPAGQFGPSCSDCPGGSGVLACSGNGSCDDGRLGSGACTCSTGFTGSDCSGCAPNFAGASCNIECPNCGEHGSCNAGISGNGACTCETGWLGTLCDQQDPCLDNPCENNGVCSNTTPGQFACQCPPNFTGETCEVPNSLIAVIDTIINSRKIIGAILKTADVEEFINEANELIDDLNNVLNSDYTTECFEKNIKQALGKVTRAITVVNKRDRVVKRAKDFLRQARIELDEARRCPPPEVRTITILDGFRNGQRIDVIGTATGFAEEDILRPWIRFPGQTGFTEGAANIAIEQDGDFNWGRKTGKRTAVQIRSADGDIRSNTVIIEAR